MIGELGDPGMIAWPLALMFASAVVIDRRRGARRRKRLNRALHELRRPLQALGLCAGTSGRAQLELAIAALADLDRALNGGAVPAARLVEPAALAAEAVERWREPAERSGRSLRLSWHGERGVVRCEPAAIARALDNLIVNSLEHGSGPIHVRGVATPGSIRLRVSDAGPRRDPPAEQPRARRRDPRRGHGEALVAAAVARHGGRFASCRDHGGATAVIELPRAG